MEKEFVAIRLIISKQKAKVSRFVMFILPRLITMAKNFCTINVEQVLSY